MSDSVASARPPWGNVPLELCAPLEYALNRLRPPDMHGWPRGEGRPVLLLPGFGQSEASLGPLSKALRQQDFHSQGWGLGRNLGIKAGMTSRLLDTLEAQRQSHGQAPALVGWSLGGTIARELARKAPHLVSQVITLGSPIAGPYATTLQPLFRLLNPGQKTASYSAQRHTAPPVRCTAVFTRSDGIVAWPTSQELEGSNTENIEVHGAHLGLGFNPAVWFLICHRLSPATSAEPFRWPDQRTSPPGRFWRRVI